MNCMTYKHIRWLNTLRSIQSGRLLVDDILKCIFLNENVHVSIKKFTDVCSQGSNWQYASICSDSGLVLGTKSSSEPTMAFVVNPHIHHSNSMSIYQYSSNGDNTILHYAVGSYIYRSNSLYSLSQFIMLSHSDRWCIYATLMPHLNLKLL